MDLQSCGSPNYENFGTLTWESWDKMPFGCGTREKAQKYYKGEGGGFPQVWAMMSLVSPNLPMVHPSTKSAPTMH
jgi:hypothetical protein